MWNTPKHINHMTSRFIEWNTVFRMKLSSLNEPSRIHRFEKCIHMLENFVWMRIRNELDWLIAQWLNSMCVTRQSKIWKKKKLKFHLPLLIDDVVLRANAVESMSVNVASEAFSDDGANDWFNPIEAIDEFPKFNVLETWCCCWTIDLYGNVYWCVDDVDDDDGGGSTCWFVYAKLYDNPVLDAVFVVDLLLKWLWTGLSSVSELLTEYAGYKRFLPFWKKKRHRSIISDYIHFIMNKVRDKNVLHTNWCSLNLISMKLLRDLKVRLLKFAYNK